MMVVNLPGMVAAKTLQGTFRAIARGDSEREINRYLETVEKGEDWEAHLWWSW